MPNPTESLGYIKCHSSSSSRPIKNPSNSIRTTVQRSAFDSDLKFENTVEIRKKVTILLVVNKPIIPKDFTYQRKKTVFSCRSFPQHT